MTARSLIGEGSRSTPLFVKLCSDKAAFEAKLQNRINLRMDHLKQLLEEENSHEILVYTPHIMVIKGCKGAEVTVSRDARAIRRVRDTAEAEMVAKDLLRLVLKAATASI